MLQLHSIRKTYKVGDTAVQALKEVSVNFRRNEFVAILGPSGCGKTTLLNIIGGLDRYDSGEMTINGRPTAQFRDGDWDAYRNHSIGFVFQSYNLIPHQTVLANVELALTLSGVPKAERRRRAKEALERVGLGDQLKKKPNQMSGGQMQRVAIARALVNNPEILLADEPTGALDSETSIQVMEILKEISKDKLIIMVTHNPELAAQYASRTIRLLDGRIVDDTAPYEGEEKQPETKEKGKKRPSMSFFTALSLSLNNLLTKKGRTILTSFAGSIGIIGIALILALSNGIKIFINRVQEDTLSSYPLTLSKEEYDYTAMFTAMTDAKDAAEREPETGCIYVNETMDSMMSAMNSTTSNDLVSFKKYLLEHYDEVADSLTAVQYRYDTDMEIFSADGKTRVYPTTVFEKMGDSMSSMMSMMGSSGDASQRFNLFDEMIDNRKLVSAQYEVLKGEWPTAWNEVVLVLDGTNSLSSMVMYMLGIEDQDRLGDLFDKLLKGEKIDVEYGTYTFDDFYGMTFRFVPICEFYTKTDTTYTVDGKTYPIWHDVRNDADYDEAKFATEHGLEVKVTCIVRPAEGAVANSINSPIGYNKELMTEMMKAGNMSEIAAQQQETVGYDVFTGLPFEKTEYTKDNIDEFLATLNDAEKGMIAAMLSSQTGMPMDASMLPAVLPQLDDTSFAALVSYFEKSTDATYDGNLKVIGVVSEEDPTKINLYAKDFKAKDKVVDFITAYNKQVAEDRQITYTDIVGLLMSSVTLIVNIITYVLVAFVSISLVVSSIMIGIITYISVLERTKEIGILRSIGASKRNISMVFDAEALIIGLCSGVFGIALTLVLMQPLNAIVQYLSGIPTIGAELPVVAAILLILISMFLTFIGGLIPAKLAAKKDPVVALRTE